MTLKTASPDVNFRALIDQISHEYEAHGQGLAHGVQKDAIQNGWGARVKQRNWSFVFTLTNASKGEVYLTMTDAGTTGLIGKVFPPGTLPDEIPPDECLARFEAMFDSGGNVGAGLFGRGKLIFNAASEKSLIYYDSLTCEGDYRFGFRQIKGRKCDQTSPVLENDAALAELKRRIGGALAPLQQAGTRITIVDPKPELKQAVRDGMFLGAIEETWWEIIKKYGAEIVVTKDDGTSERAQIPCEFGGLPENDSNGWRVHKKDLKKVDIKGSLHTIKSIHLLVPPENHKMKEEHLGVHVQRKGMKIGPMNLGGIPDSIQDRFFGYTVLDQKLEELMAKIENTTHYGFSRRTVVYRAVKQAVQDEVDAFLQRLGFGKKGKDPDEETKRNLEDARAELNTILSGLGVPGFGTGIESPPGFTLTLEDLEFPNDTNYLRTGDKLSGFWYSLSNASSNDARGKFIVFTHDRNGGEIEVLVNRKDLTIEPNASFETDSLTLNIDSGKYPQHEKLGCTARFVGGSGQLRAKKTFYFFVDLQEPAQPDRFVDIDVEPVVWPRKNSRRVDYGQSLDQVRYTVRNLTPREVHVKAKVRTLWVAERNEPIDEIVEQDMKFKAFQDKSVEVGKIFVSENRYGEVQRGKINLRCHAVALRKTKHWDKGEKLAEHTLAFYLNMDPDYGFFEDYTYWDGGPDDPRSEAEPIEGARAWQLRINLTHPAFLEARGNSDRELQYFLEESARQVVYVLLRKNQMDSLKKLAALDPGQDLDALDQEDLLKLVAYRITDKIMALHYKE